MGKFSDIDVVVTDFNQANEDLAVVMTVEVDDLGVNLKIHPTDGTFILYDTAMDLVEDLKHGLDGFDLRGVSIQFNQQGNVEWLSSKIITEWDGV